MRVLFLSMPVHHTINIPGMHSMPPTALYLLAAILQEKGYDVIVVDPITIRGYLDINGQDSLPEILDSYIDECDVVCISSNTLNWSMTKMAINTIKEMTDKPIVVGGIHPSYFFE